MIFCLLFLIPTVAGFETPYGVETRCGAEPYMMENANFIEFGWDPGNVLWKKFECDRGFAVTGLPYIRCYANEDSPRWLLFGICEKVNAMKTCGRDPRIDNGYMRPGPNTVGSTRTLTCNRGFQIAGDATVLCGSDGLWKLRGTCQIGVPLLENCRDFIRVPNAIVNGDGGSEFGSRRYFTCDDGSYLVGSNFVTCQPPGFWDPSGECRKGCGPPPSLTNGGFFPGSSDTYSTRAAYCENGYELNTLYNTIACRENGMWTRFTGMCLQINKPMLVTADGIQTISFPRSTTPSMWWTPAVRAGASSGLVTRRSTRGVAVRLIPRTTPFFGRK